MAKTTGLVTEEEKEEVGRVLREHEDRMEEGWLDSLVKRREVEKVWKERGAINKVEP
jgi:hypothetical protein